MRKIAVLVLAMLLAIIFGPARLGSRVMDFLDQHGLVEGTAVILLLGLHVLAYHLYEAWVAEARQRVTDRDAEIQRYAKINERLAAENDGYRDRFFRLIDKMHDMEDKK